MYERKNKYSPKNRGLTCEKDKKEGGGGDERVDKNEEKNY